MRRSSIIRARNSRISGRVCPNSNAARAMTGATSAALPRGTFVRSRSPRVASPGAAHAVHGVFEMRCFARRRPDNPQRRRRPRRRSDGRLGQRRRCGQATRTPQRAMTERAQCLHRTRRSNLLGQRWHGGARAGTEQKFAVRWCGVVEPALYTVEGRQTGDLRQKCGSALIRKAKLPARSCGRPCLLAGTADRPHLSASAPQGGGSCVASWSSMTTGTLAWR